MDLQKIQTPQKVQKYDIHVTINFLNFKIFLKVLFFSKTQQKAVAIKVIIIIVYLEIFTVMTLILLN